MIVDTSAVLAILFNEEDAESYARAISEAESAGYRPSILWKQQLSLKLKPKSAGVVSSTPSSDALGLSSSRSPKSRHTPLGKPTRISARLIMRRG